MNRFTLSCLALCVGLILLPNVHAEEAGDKAKEAPELVTVVRGPLGATIEAKGTLVPVEHARITIEFEAYRGRIEIVESAPEGPVVKGQVLTRFDETEYREQLEVRARDIELRRIGLERAERLHEVGAEALALRRDEALRARRLADEALARFVEVERKLSEEDAKYNLEGRTLGIENTREELAQLEKMYTEDDLTEETEEIVLRRNRRNMERMIDAFERFRKRFDYDARVGLEREHEGLRLALRKAASGLDAVQATLALDLKKGEIDLDVARAQLREAEEGLQKLSGDADAFRLIAPIAGQAVRGSFDSGAWKGLGNDEAYEAGEKMNAGQVPWTIVNESAMRVHTSVKEDDLADVKAGGSASFTTALTGEDVLQAEVGFVARYGAGGNYQVILRVQSADERLRAGLGCTAKLARAAPEQVLSLPATCIKSEGGKHYAWTEDGTRVELRIGRKVDDRVEILEGLTAGTPVLAAPPAEKVEKTEKAQQAEKANGGK
ncbi:MAG: hypothetical protein O2894_08375 [Planctomycetota bacterium]|nr:hypothetical protein [Planctomycetota bacterium]